MHSLATVMQKVWIFALCLLTAAVASESILPEHKTYIINALAENTVMIKTWTYRATTFFITVKKEKETLLSEFFDGVSAKRDKEQDQEDRLLMKYNTSTNKVSLLFNNISRNDEGLYQIYTSIYQGATEDLEKNEDKWKFQLNVLEPGEIKQGNVGENITIMEFDHSSVSFPRVYYNDQVIAVLSGSACDVSTNSPLYGRLRCASDKDNKKSRIEINNLTENDTGLYKVKMEEIETVRCFLNITVIGTTVANVSNTVTVSVISDGINSSQPSNESLLPTALSSTPKNPVIPYTGGVLFNIMLIATVAFAMILLLIGSMIWIQRRNTNSIEAVQRIVLEKIETASSATPSTLGRCQHTPPREEGWMSQSIYWSNAVQNPTVILPNPALPKDSTSFHTPYNNTLQKVVDDNYRLEVTDNILNICDSSNRANENLLEVFHEGPGSLIDGCPSLSVVLSAAESEADFDISISDATGQTPVARSTEDMYAKVKKVPRFSFKTNNFLHTSKAGALCKDGYEMVDVSRFDNPINAFQDFKIASVSAGTPISPFHGISTSVHDFDHGTKDEDGYNKFATVMNTTSAENIKGYDDGNALSTRLEEQEEQNMIPDNPYNDYADINFK